MKTIENEIGEKYAASERNGILMLIAHLQDLLEADTGAYKQLNALHKMICDGAHQPYVAADRLEQQED